MLFVLLVNISVVVVCFDVKKVPDELFIPLTEEEKDEVYRAFSGKNRYGALVKRFFFIACLCGYLTKSICCPSFQKESLGYSCELKH